MNAEALVKAIDSVPFVEYCRCGRPRSEHTYWEDRIYDYNGYRCPGGLGSDYQHDAVITNRQHAIARAAILSAEAEAEVIALRQRIAALEASLRVHLNEQHFSSTHFPKGSQRNGHQGDQATCPHPHCQLLASGGDDRRG